MEPQTQPHPASLKVPDFAEWATNTTECTLISLVEEKQGDTDVKCTTFSPEFTYAIFGDHETAFGYKDLSIKLDCTSGGLTTLFEVDYSENHVAADNVTEILGEYLHQGYLTDRHRFMDAVKKDADTFRPLGEKISEYTREINGIEEHFEIYKTSFSSAKFRDYHGRMQLFVLLFIEGSSFIEDDDDKWEIYTTFKRDGSVYHFMGYCTSYPFYCWPENIRMRISQFLMLPPYKKQGHGSKLYQTIYEIFKSRPEICEITVEDPNEEFSDMRDKNDIRHLLNHGAFQGLKAPVSADVIADLCTQFKLTNRQTQRCIEMYLLSNIDKINVEEYKAYRLQVKQRLYSFNFDVLREMDVEERKEKLQETYLGVEEDYHRLLEII